MAEIIGRENDRQTYQELSQEIKSDFNAYYYDVEQENYYHGGRTPLATALFAGLVEEENESGVLQSLLRAIVKKNGQSMPGW